MIKANLISQNYLANTVNPCIDLPQRIEALDVTESVLITAPAGSGKTELLTQRYLALLSTVNEPEEILAISFTNKSGNEMRSRIINALIKADSQPEPAASHEQLSWQLAKNALKQAEVKGWDVLNNPNRLRIKTNDAFYGSLARRAPLSGHIGGGMQITDDYKNCYLKAARELLGDLEDSNAWTHSLEIILGHVDNRFDRAEELLVGLLEKREHWLPIVLSARDTTDLRNKLEDTLKLVIVDLINEIKNSLNVYQSDIVDLASFASENINPDKSIELKPLNFLTDHDQLPDANCEHKDVWVALGHLMLTKGGELRKSPTAAIGFPAPSGTKDKELKTRYKDKKDLFKELLSSFTDDDEAVKALKTIQMLPPSTYQDAEWEVLQHLLQLLPILAAKLLLVFQSEGVVDHSEISTAALRVLGDADTPTDLALVLDAQLKHILIDEFQDTNNLQMNGLEVLTAGWEQGDGRSLFLVGDPMQSLYSFRGSNVGLFLDVASKGVSNVPIKSIELSVNFRSQENIVNWVNNTFKQVFPTNNNSNLGAITYSESVAHLPSIADNEAVQIACFSGDKSEARYTEGQWIAEQVIAIKDNNENESIAVLVRNRSHLHDIVKALQEKEVAYQAIDIDPLRDRHAVRDLSTLTRALCHLGDRTAWLALLRSPLCGLELSELELIATENAKSLIWENLNSTKIISELSSATQSRINLLIGVLRDSMRWKERKSLAIVVEGAWLGLSGPSCIEQEADLENVEAFFKILKRFDYTTFDADTFDSTLTSLYAKPNISESNPVQLLTLHKSKGLQFDNVFIPACERRSRSDGARLLAWNRFTTKDGTEVPMLSPSPEIGGGKNSLYDFINQQGSMRINFERDRIMYVGCTRAIRNLYISFCTSEDDEGKIEKPAERSFIGSLWTAIEDQMQYIPASNVPVQGSRPQNGQLKRLAHVTIAPLPEGNLLEKYRGRMTTNNEELPDLAWSLDYTAKLGKLFHRILRRVCLDGMNTWCEQVIQSKKAAWGHQLLQLGIPNLYATQCVNQIVEWLNEVLRDTQAKWILDNTHSDSQCELGLSTMEKGKQKQYVIDRTFIDSGTRWIIDYKTSTPIKDESMLQFEARMLVSHRDQLLKYDALMSNIGTEPVKCALYLTATQSFLEFDLPHQKSAA